MKKRSDEERHKEMAFFVSIERRNIALTTWRKLPPDNGKF